MKVKRYQVWIIAGIMALVCGSIFFSTGETSIVISEKRFEQMVLSKDVKGVVLIHKGELVEITLKEESLQLPAYQAELENQGSSYAGPHYQLRIDDTESFVAGFNALMHQLPEGAQIGYQVEDRSHFSDHIFRNGIYVLLLLGLYLLIRPFIQNRGYAPRT